MSQKVRVKEMLEKIFLKDLEIREDSLKFNLLKSISMGEILVLSEVIQKICVKDVQLKRSGRGITVIVDFYEEK